ncbi:MAG TPA: hypothetical protein VE913_17510, partial [Longimicrobium sp.]|nr:hypothetical protein [Longimicrobium sp.]
MPHDADGELDLTGVAERNIITVPNTAFRLDLRDRWVTISHWYDRKALFPREPRMDDVRQSAIPDCFLLAALHSTIQVNPKLILRMIRDLRGGWVVVRFFDAGAPVYYKIQKDYLTNPNLDIARHGAPWVYMVEKAFAHYRLLRNFQCTPLSWNERTRTWDRGARRAARTYREALTGGQPHEVFPILTGGQGAVHDIDAEVGSSRPASTLVHIVRVELDDLVLSAEQQAAFRAVFGAFTGPRVLDLVRNNTQDKRMALVSLFYPVGGNNYEKIVRAENLATYFNTHYAALQPATRLAIDTYIGDNFPG